MPWYEFEGKKPTVHQEAFVHPLAVLIGEVQIEAGCYIGAGAVLRGDIGRISIGAGSNVQENCVVHTFPGKAAILHPNTHIGHGAILHGCEIHPSVLVGMGSIIADGAIVFSNCIIGAGSLVVAGTQIPAGSLVMGVPARVVKPISPQQLDQLNRARGIYQELARRYLKSFKEVPMIKD